MDAISAIIPTRYKPTCVCITHMNLCVRWKKGNKILGVGQNQNVPQSAICRVTI